MLLLRMRAHPLPEARAYAELMLEELRKVIPSFLKRVDVSDRGGVWASYLAQTRTATESAAHELLAGELEEPVPSVTLTDFDPDAEDKLLAAILYPHSDLPDHQLLARVRRLVTDERMTLLRAYVGERSNRRHKPGRAFERVDYRFDVLADYGAFRDLQRHRMLTIEWQPLSPRHGFDRPDTIDAADCTEQFDAAMERSAELYSAMAGQFPQQAPYALAMAYRIRFSMQMNAREAMHLLELRTGPQGHPAYRRVGQEMHRLIAEQAGHRAIAETMRFVDHRESELERLDAERRAEARRLGR
jgi:thymidylate synthase ThyX